MTEVRMGNGTVGEVDPTQWYRPFGWGMALGVSPVLELIAGNLLPFGDGFRRVVAYGGAALGLAALVGIAVALIASPRRPAFALGVGAGLLMGAGLWFIAALFSLFSGGVLG